MYHFAVMPLLLKDIPASEYWLRDPGQQDLEDFLNIVRSLSEETPGNVTVGVIGDWGTGKTSFLLALQKRFASENIPVVYYEAWKFADDPHPLPSLLKTLEQSLQGPRRSLHQARERLGELIQNLRLSVELRLPLLTVSAETDSHFLPASLQWELYEKLNRSIEQVLRATRKTRTPIGLVLLVDDLDRLLPEKAFHVMEVLRFYFDLDRVLVIMGVNDRVIVRHLQKRLDTEDREAEGFLDKVFHWRYEMPPARFNRMAFRLQEEAKLSDKELGILQEIFEDEYLHLPFRKWIKLFNRILLHRQRGRQGSLPFWAFLAAVYELAPGAARAHLRPFGEILENRLWDQGLESQDAYLQGFLAAYAEDTSVVGHPARVLQALYQRAQGQASRL